MFIVQQLTDDKRDHPMRINGKIGALIMFVLLLGAGIALGRLRNLAPDAVTRATQGYNVYEGDIAYLTDGKYPGNSDAPGAFTWPNKGDIVFTFPRPEEIAKIRLFVGDDAGAYQATAYQGAMFGADGQTLTGGATVVTRVENSDFVTNDWVELTFPAGTKTDYIELATNQGAIFYEIEILGPDGSATGVEPYTWGEVKKRMQNDKETGG